MNNSNLPVFVGHQRSRLFELDRVEIGFFDILTAQGIPAQRSRDLDTNTTPRVELELTTEQNLSQRHIFTGETTSQFLPYNTWDFKLAVTVVTNREENGDNHLPLIGLARWNCQMFTLLDTWTFALNPYHTIIDIREESGSPDVWNDGGCDLTKLSFAGMFNIRESAW